MRKKPLIIKKVQVILLIICMTASILSVPLNVTAETEVNFAKALQLSLYFYDANKCGEGITGGRLEWRGDCHVEDKEIPLIPMTEDYFGTNLSQSFIDEYRDVLDPDGNGTLDLSGGMHDAGDHVKFGLPGTYAASTVGWGYYEFRDAYEKVGEKDHVEDILRWFNDFYLKATFLDDDGKVIAYCYQVGEGNIDHNYWNPPELQNSSYLLDFARPAYFATVETPASDQSAGAAASLAINYLNFKDEDPEYAQRCLDTAIALYDFARENRELGYSGGFYGSSYDHDELAWAAVWLNIATGNMEYIDHIVETDSAGYYTGYMQRIIKDTGNDWQNIWVHCWDTVWGGVFAKLAPITNTDRDWYIFRWNLEYWSGIPHENSKDTTFLAQSPAGYSVVNSYGSARYNTAAQLCALVYRKYTGREDFADWAKGQMEYIIGNNPMDRSYIVGYSENSAKHPHHRAAHGSKTYSMLDPEEHRHTLWGALVGGPDLDDNHVDETTDYVYNEVAVDYNAAFVGASAGLYHYYGEELGHKPIENFPPKEEDVEEFFLEAKVEQENKERTQVTVKIYNDTCHPPRFIRGMMTRYFFNISELLDAGQTIDDMTVEIYYDENAASYDGPATLRGPIKYDDSGTYYVELDWTGRTIYGAREIQFALVSCQDSNYNSNWDPANDYSREGLGKEYIKTDKIPLYVDGEKVCGNEPLKVEPSPTPTLDPHITPSPTPEETPSLEVSYKIGDTESAIKDIKASIRIKNTGKKPVDLSNVKIRYWFTKDSATGQEFACDYAHIGKGLVTGTFVDLETPVENADNYLEIGFDEDAGILGAGANTGEIQFRIIKGNFEAYDQSNDYSYMPDAIEFTANPCITAYVNSVLAYGISPVEEDTPDIVYGDLNGDDEVNSTDLTLLKRRLLRKIDKFDVPDTHADLNIDGSIDSSDLTILKRYLLRKITELPVITN